MTRLTLSQRLYGLAGWVVWGPVYLGLWLAAPIVRLTGLVKFKPRTP
jgi:hypothetical protein